MPLEKWFKSATLNNPSTLSTLVFDLTANVPETQETSGRLKIWEEKALRGHFRLPFISESEAKHLTLETQVLATWPPG